MATQPGGASQFPDAAPSQLDPTAHGADYGFLDFTQQDGPTANAGGAIDSALPQFSAFSQVHSVEHKQSSNLQITPRALAPCALPAGAMPAVCPSSAPPPAAPLALRSGALHPSSTQPDCSIAKNHCCALSSLHYLNAHDWLRTCTLKAAMSANCSVHPHPPFLSARCKGGCLFPAAGHIGWLGSGRRFAAKCGAFAASYAESHRAICKAASTPFA